MSVWVIQMSARYARWTTLRGLEVGERLIGASEHGRELSERSMDRTARDLIGTRADLCGERFEGSVLQRGELSVADPRSHLSEHRHPEQPAIVEWQSLLATEEDLGGEAESLVRAAGLQGREREQRAEEPVSRIHRACRDEGLLQLPEPALFPPQHAEGLEVRGLRVP